MIDLSAITLVSDLDDRRHSAGFCTPLVALARLAGEPDSESPRTCCPVFGSFLRVAIRLASPATLERMKLIVPGLVGTSGTDDGVRQERAYALAEWARENVFPHVDIPPILDATTAQRAARALSDPRRQEAYMGSDALVMITALLDRRWAHVGAWAARTLPGTTRQQWAIRTALTLIATLARAAKPTVSLHTPRTSWDRVMGDDVCDHAALGEKPPDLVIHDTLVRKWDDIKRLGELDEAENRDAVAILDEAFGGPTRHPAALTSPGTAAAPPRTP